jgi:hypothetical protein
VAWVEWVRSVGVVAPRVHRLRFFDSALIVSRLSAARPVRPGRADASAFRDLKGEAFAIGQAASEFCAGVVVIRRIARQTHTRFPFPTSRRGTPLAENSVTPAPGHPAPALAAQRSAQARVISAVRPATIVGDDEHEMWTSSEDRRREHDAKYYAVRARRSSQGRERIIEDACAAIICVLKQLDEHIDP